MRTLGFQAAVPVRFGQVDREKLARLQEVSQQLHADLGDAGISTQAGLLADLSGLVIRPAGQVTADKISAFLGGPDESGVLRYKGTKVILRSFGAEAHGQA